MEDFNGESEAITSSISDVEKVQEKPVMIRRKSGKKLIILLDFFRDLYMKSLKKIGAVFSKKDKQKKSQIISLRRNPSDSSLNWSKGNEESQSEQGIDKYQSLVGIAVECSLTSRRKRGKLGRFKVKTPEVQSGGGGGGGRGGGRGGGGGGRGGGQAQGRGKKASGSK
ncbi:uncharacterized protein LOC132061065 [Lycium ferocissimum]|uniref:uncharacterized protein LOC132061065 n=1 Tax=Lycium ferocissimum TaxID=112874 RepID=UPI0028161FA2|nr:uncharacterized protein LOC132061065 [Lycium ferocissimum]